MMKWSERCHYVWERRGDDCKYPCSLLAHHGGAHRDGYGHENNPPESWYERIDYEQVFEELSERIAAAGREDLLEGL